MSLDNTFSPKCTSSPSIKHIKAKWLVLFEACWPPPRRLPLLLLLLLLLVTRFVCDIWSIIVMIGIGAHDNSRKRQTLRQLGKSLWQSDLCLAPVATAGWVEWKCRLGLVRSSGWNGLTWVSFIEWKLREPTRRRRLDSCKLKRIEVRKECYMCGRLRDGCKFYHHIIIDLFITHRDGLGGVRGQVWTDSTNMDDVL